MSKTQDVVPGDWVRFYRNGIIVLGLVEYVRDAARWPHTREALTDVGVVAVEDVLEIRHRAVDFFPAPTEAPRE